MAKSKKKLAFISFSSSDDDKVKILQDLFKGKRNLAPRIVVRERHSMKNLDEKIIDSLDECEFFIPILTEKSYLTQWINQEIGVAKLKIPKDKTFPIVEKAIIEKLHGFIHDQLSLPDTFLNLADNSDYIRACKDVITDLVRIVNKTEDRNKLLLSDIFIGMWVNKYTHPVNGDGKEIFHIANGNQYLVKNKHIFDIKKVKLNSAKNRLRFTKVRLTDNTEADSDLLLQPDGTWEGSENIFTPVLYESLGV